MIELLRQTRPGAEVEKDEAADEAHARGEVSQPELLVALHERGSREVFEAAEVLCRDDRPEERTLGLRILRELGPSDKRPVYAETWPLLEEMVETEEDDDVLYWVLSCLWYTGNPRVIDTLVRFSSHPDDLIRQTIAFGLAGCGPDDPRVVEALLRLARDPVDEVRGYAVYDFVESITADSSEIRAVLTGLLDDPDEGVRRDAAAALKVREPGGKAIRRNEA